VRSAVLAGGKSSRFGGRPKGLERIGGERLLDRIVAVLETATGTQPILVANDPQAASWHPDLRVVRDVMPNCGSLGGIYTAVTDGPGAVLVLAWDMPFVTPQLLAALMRDATGFDAFLPESLGPRGVEPLCAIYGPGCASPLLMSLAAFRFEATAFHSAIRSGTMPLQSVRRFGDPNTLFFNVNEPDDLREAERIASRL
jgi:molybdopterin-guanine dinucleotide biosynthesis protein A